MMNATTTESHIATAMKPPADRWAAVISWLKCGTAGESPAADGSSQPVRRIRRDSNGAPRRSIAAERAHTPSARTKTARVTFIERFTAKSVSITWRDATAANYCEQLWIRRISRSQGVCALTGSAIARGDAVYSPAGRATGRPANCAQMVLAHVLEGLE